MSTPRLRKRIAAASLSPTVARTFADGLAQLVALAPQQAKTKQRLIERLLGTVPSTQTPSAPFDALWPHGELFLTACIYVAVTDGQYRVEEARQVSAFAHRLGLSAQGLKRLEAKVFAELGARSAGKSPEQVVTSPL